MLGENWKKLIGVSLITLIIVGVMVVPAMAEDDESAADPGNGMKRMEQMINQAVESGKITQEQAGKLLGMVENGELPDGNTFRSRIRHSVQWQGSNEVDPAQCAERLAQAVADGKLTQEQANRCLSAVGNGDIPRGFGLRGGNQGAWQIDRDIDLEQMAARISQAVQEGRMTQEQAERCLSAAENGDLQNRNRFNLCIRTRTQWQESHDIDPEQMRTRLAQAVADGKLTQEQANNCFAAVENGDLPKGFGLGSDGNQVPRRGDREIDSGKMADRISQAVEEGKVTQDQADELLEDIENGERPGGFGPSSGSSGNSQND